MNKRNISQSEYQEHLNQCANYDQKETEEPVVSCWDCGKYVLESETIKFKRLHGTTCANYCKVCFNELKGGV